MRWQYYVLERSRSLVRFWKYHLETSTRKILYVLGKGFDPRMCLGLETLTCEAGLKSFDVWLIEWDEGPDSPSHIYAGRVKKNQDKLDTLVSKEGCLMRKPVELWSQDGRPVGSRNVARLFRNACDFEKYTDIIVDVSALPRGLYYPCIAALTDLLDSAIQRPVNLHVFAWDDADLDKEIRDQGIQDQADYLFPFGGDDREAAAHLPTVWIPLLGEEQESQLRLIDEYLGANKEIVPILPFPSFDPRRADKLFLKYRELLLEGLRVEPAYFAYAAEQNPFAVYRQIMRIVRRYRMSLEPLGGVRFALSALSSKLFSLGALLAAYEMRSKDIGVGVAHVECRGYNIDNDVEVGGELFGLWLSGELYEK